MNQWNEQSDTMNDAKLLAWCERQSFYSLQRAIIIINNQLFTDRVAHLAKMFPEAFPEPPIEAQIEALATQFKQELAKHLEDTDD